ncbi:hypothetical protein O6H91_22G060300 [Diphasiastrum complanatum]|uniref:Uncharacterized protein n=1 Tax=Diphasiastrum complanatum TaxID=34168 RepID=A0ACC2AG38_DIPCM|nr:hypothetical protein O6H91_22G060300 [Diphasiastrum complanatum]
MATMSHISLVTSLAGHPPRVKPFVTKWRVTNIEAMRPLVQQLFNGSVLPRSMIQYIQFVVSYFCRHLSLFSLLTASESSGLFTGITRNLTSSLCICGLFPLYKET